MTPPAESRPPALRKSVLLKSVLQPSALRTSVPRTIGRLLLGAFLLLAGISHLTVSRVAFRAQVPPWLPLDTDFVVVASGIVEITLGLALVLLARRRVLVGLVVAVFFLLILPGNISQLVTQTDSFGLNSDLSRGIRLLFQPILVIWALWSTGAWKAIRASRSPG
ncbi:putative membrane protein [Frigoribacterium sp. CG_9.8]|nr:putative membrane protein [Frigoribacterium sp. CG_9.8]